MDWGGPYLIEVDEESLRRREGAAGFQRLLDDLNRGFYARAILAEASVRAEVAALEAAPLVTNEGNLRPRVCVSGVDFHYWGQRKGYECWEDDEFVREYERDNPECRVNPRMANARVVVPGRLGRDGRDARDGRDVNQEEAA